jgi:hypothetical protein
MIDMGNGLMLTGKMLIGNPIIKIIMTSSLRRSMKLSVCVYVD